ncbi:hypothetical protein AJ80_07610 [Polytolypa hystricis UAMH7299]|uniref:DUF1446 domain-containing protein n=1 Tax=Polytolypa hystricis (strain UAMH7299) TaxID=1447883 RepID=A0A2B7XLT8_POLH7|nr:hypothetical protein AJ80_07610 [Polytolypa hystricis UAMH7299]
MKPVKIACYSAFWGDSASAVKQFLENDEPRLDYVVADYLAELTMGLLARFSAQSKKGYISEFLDLVLAPYLDLILKKRIKIVTNAGGLDPVGLKQAIEEHLQKRGLGNRLKVAAIYGDNILSDRESLQREGAFEKFDPLSGASTEEAGIEESGKLLSLNAYTGAEPITEALKQSADIVVTGRCVDSALVVGPLAYEYGWKYTAVQEDLDRLASASLAGHIIECGAQATGGNFTDWKKSACSPDGGWSNMGYPILTFNEDSTFSISKPERTGGVVTCNSVCEQMLYEVLDPENYVLPDVLIDMSQVRLEQTSLGVVTVRGAKGKPPTPWLKCTAVEQKGFRISVDILVCGEEAESKAKTLGRAIIDRTNALAAERFSGTMSPILPSDAAVMLIGNESSLGTSTHRTERREIALRVAARHADRKVLDILSKEAASFLTNSCPGICLLTSGRAKASPNFVASSTLISRERVVPKVQTTGATWPKSVPLFTDGCRLVEPAPGLIQVSGGVSLPHGQGPTQVRLHDVAIGRSGDKGDTANIAIIARDSSYYQYILDQVTPEVIFSQFSHFIASGGTVTRFEVPGVSAVNFVLTRSLGGGGLSSLRLDR